MLISSERTGKCIFLSDGDVSAFSNMLVENMHKWDGDWFERLSQFVWEDMDARGRESVADSPSNVRRFASAEEILAGINGVSEGGETSFKNDIDVVADSVAKEANATLGARAIPGLTEFVKLGLDLLFTMLENCLTNSFATPEQVKESAASGDATARGMISRANRRAERQILRKRKREGREAKRFTRRQRDAVDDASVNGVKQHPQMVSDFVDDVEDAEQITFDQEFGSGK